MDPASILGIAAASFQFAEIALKTVSKLVQVTQALEEAPRRMRDQLHDIERSIVRLREFSAELEQDPITSAISPARVVGLKLTVENWVATAGDLESRLGHLLNAPTTSKGRNWKNLKVACKSLSQSDEIQWQVLRLRSLSHQVWEELLRTLLESQLQVQNRIIDGEVKISSRLQESFRKLGDEQTDCENRLAATLREEGVETRAALGNLEVSLNASLDQLNLQASSGYFHVVDKINAHVSEEFRLMRTSLSSMTLGNHLALNSEGESRHKTSEPVHNGALFDTEDDIGSGETTWATVDASVLSNQISGQSQFGSHELSPTCCCPSRSGQIWRISKGVHLRYRAVAHDASCPLAPTSHQLRNITIQIALPRFLGPTFELSITTYAQRNGCTLSQSLRYFQTVKRLESPIFSEFDTIHAFLNGNHPETWEQSDFSEFRSILRNLPKKLQSIAASGAGSCCDKDEVGNTLLLEVVYLMFRLKCRLHSLSPELTQLMCFLRRAGLDASGMGYRVWRSSSPKLSSLLEPMDGYRLGTLHIKNSHESRSTKATAQSWAVVLAQEIKDSFPLHSYFEGFELEENCSIGPTFPCIGLTSGCARANQRQKAVSFYCHYTDLASNLGTLEGAVARRDVTALKHVLQKGNFDPCKYTTKLILSELDLSVFQLSMDWQVGIEILLTKLSPTSADVEFAIYMDNQLSLNMLWDRLCEPLDYQRVFDILLRSSDECQKRVVGLLQASRLRLCRLAMAHLGDHDKEISSSDPCFTEVWRPYEIWTELMSQGCSVPPRYKPMQRDALFAFMSMDETILNYCHEGGRGDCTSNRSASDLLQDFYDLGFVEVDCHQMQPETVSGFRYTDDTPFVTFLVFTRYMFGDFNLWFTRFADICCWFLKNGASAQMSGDHIWPNILFFLARFVGLDPWHSDQFHHGSNYSLDLTKYQDLWDAALTVCSAEQSDTCRCFCSDSGCLPSRAFLQPTKMNLDGSQRYRVIVPRPVLDKRLLSWFKLCGLSKEEETRYVKDAVRLEIFNRLGMTHTCCELVDELEWDRDRRLCPQRVLVTCQWQSDSDEIQIEESELRIHLDLIMEAYISFSRDFEHWEIGLPKWWALLDKVLPDLSDLRIPHPRHFKTEDAYEDAFHQMEHDRAMTEAQTLNSNGYGDMDFIDVIYMHFGKYL